MKKEKIKISWSKFNIESEDPGKYTIVILAIACVTIIIISWLALHITGLSL